MRFHFSCPTMMDPPTTDISHVLLYECATDSAADVGTLVATLPFVALQGYVDYSTPVEGKFYKIKFKDSGDKVSTYPSAPVKYTTVPEVTCQVFDTQIDMSGRPITNMPIRIILNSPNARFNGKTIGNNDMTITTDENGIWDVQLVPNSLIVPAGTKYLFTIAGKSYERVVPNEMTKRFADLR